MEDKIGFLKGIVRINILRDLTYLISGILILIIVNFFFKPSLSTYPNIDYFGPIGRYVGICITAYFTARVFSEIGGFITESLLFLLAKNNLNRTSILIDYMNSVREHKEKEGSAIDLNTKMIFHAEVMQYLYDKPEMYSLYERHAQKLMYETIFLGFSFVMLFFTSNFIITLVIFLVLIFRVIKTKLNFSALHSKVTILLVREKQDKAPF